MASEMPFKGADKVPCIEELLVATACFVPAESYQVTLDFLTLALKKEGGGGRAGVWPESGIIKSPLRRPKVLLPPVQSIAAPTDAHLAFSERFSVCMCVDNAALVVFPSTSLEISDRLSALCFWYVVFLTPRL